jgi:hypothetical protein
MALKMLGREKYTQLSHLYLNIVLLRLKVLLKSRKYIHRHAMILPAELIKARANTLHSEIQKLTVSIWNKEGLPQKLKEYIIIPIYKKGERTEYGNYTRILVLPSTYKVLSNILVSGLIPYREKIIRNH